MQNDHKKGIIPATIDDLMEITAVKALNKQRQRGRRLEVSVPVVVETVGQYFQANLIDISENGMRIDKEFSTSHKTKCIVTLQTKPPLVFSCMPIIGQTEFERGLWNRLKSVKPIDLDKVLAAIQSTFGK